MTRRFASLLDRLARAVLAGTVIAPLIFSFAQVVPSRPDVQWTVSIPWFGGPQIGIASELLFDPPWGSALVLVNQGNADSEDVRIVISAELPRAPARPEHVDVAGRAWREYELIPTDTGVIIDLGPMEPGERIEVTLFRVTWMEADVVHGDEIVPLTIRPPFFDPQVRLPRWVLLAGLFLMAGLALRILAMQCRTVSRER